MKVHELIKALLAMPQDEEVFIEPCEPECLSEAPIQSLWREEADGRIVVQLSRAKVD